MTHEEKSRLDTCLDNADRLYRTMVDSAKIAYDTARLLNGPVNESVSEHIEEWVSSPAYAAALAAYEMALIKANDARDAIYSVVHERMSAKKSA